MEDSHEELVNMYVEQAQTNPSPCFQHRETPTFQASVALPDFALFSVSRLSSWVPVLSLAPRGSTGQSTCWLLEHRALSIQACPPFLFLSFSRDLPWHRTSPALASTLLGSFRFRPGFRTFVENQIRRLLKGKRNWKRRLQKHYLPLEAFSSVTKEEIKR